MFEYLEYNEVLDKDSQRINVGDLNDGICYYLVPENYESELAQLDLEGNCTSEEVIKIKSNQNLPSYEYNIFPETYGMVENPILEIMTNDELSEHISYDGVYYPVDENGQMKDKEYVIDVLKKYSIYDNTLPFQSINEKVAYEFLGVMTIIKVLVVCVILLFILLLIILTIVVRLYFEENYLEINLYKLEGFTFFQRYRKLLMMLFQQMIFELLVIQLFIGFKNNYLLFLAIVLIVNIFIWAIIVVNIIHLERKNENLIIKGEKL